MWESEKYNGLSLLERPHQEGAQPPKMQGMCTEQVFLAKEMVLIKMQTQECFRHSVVNGEEMCG